MVLNLLALDQLLWCFTQKCDGHAPTFYYSGNDGGLNAEIYGGNTVSMLSFQKYIHFDVLDDCSLR